MINILTKILDKKLGLNRSRVPYWLERSKEVLTTFFAFDENQRVTIIIVPETNKKIVGVWTFWVNCIILKLSAETPEPNQALYDWKAAIGTPIKFTKSLPANASAKAKVPTPIIIL